MVVKRDLWCWKKDIGNGSLLKSACIDHVVVSCSVLSHSGARSLQREEQYTKRLTQEASVCEKRPATAHKLMGSVVCRALNHSDTRNDFCCSFFWTYTRLFCGSLFVYVNSFLTVSSSLNHFDTRNLRKAYLYKKSPTKETYVCEKRPTIAHGMMMLLYHQSVDNYGVAMISRLLQITGLFCRI